MQDCQELTDVERAIETVINQFHCYAVKGQKEYLTPNEMQELVVQKLPHLGKVRTEPRGWAGGAGVGTGCLRDPPVPITLMFFCPLCSALDHWKRRSNAWETLTRPSWSLESTGT